MKRMIFCLALLMSHQVISDDFTAYTSIGIGYKLQEPNTVIVNGRKEHLDFGTDDTALVEFGIEYKDIQFGFKHDSQYLTGWPVNHKPEYYKTELFIRYRTDLFTF